jgi:hypothetical protein
MLWYGLAAASFRNQKAEINFGGPVTSETPTTPGFTFGFGAEYKPDFLQGLGMPVSLYLQYQHSWYRTLQIDGGAASPGFKYSFDNTDDLVKFGVNVQMSDIRLKRDIEPLRKLDNGLALYRYRYLWSDQVYVGVMAQEVARIVPEAVVIGADNYLRVDYARLGLRMQTWEDWNASQPAGLAP